MSLSLLKRSLQLVEENLELGNPKDKKKKEKSTETKQKKKTKSSVIDLIPENQRLTVYERNHKGKGKRKLNYLNRYFKHSIF